MRGYKGDPNSGIHNISSQNANFTNEGVYELVYPPMPQYSKSCVTNLDYATLPPGYPMRKEILGQSTLKHLYRGPQYYPPQYMNVPVGTMYEYDSQSFDANGKLRTYRAPLYPFHQRSPREVREYAEQLLPLPALQLWTEYRTLKDGAWGR